MKTSMENARATAFCEGVGVTAPVVKDTFATYTPGVSERRSGVSKFQHSGIKNADGQSNVSQFVTATRVYDAFGNVTSSQGTFSGPFGYGGPFGYQEDSETGCKLLGHRYYDPTTGRFLSRDRVKDGRNWYGYCDNNPLTWVDPNGRDRIQVPPAPPGVNVRRNIRRMDEARKRCVPVGLLFANLVREGGEWDYKRRGKRFEAFGNFHYGVVAAAIGYEEAVALKFAGAAQKLTRTSKPAWGNPWDDEGPYGDDPEDQHWIRMGYRYYWEVIRCGK